MVGAAAALVVFGLSLTVVAGPLMGHTDRTAAYLKAPAQYVDAVLVGGDRGTGESVDVVEQDHEPLPETREDG